MREIVEAAAPGAAIFLPPVGRPDAINSDLAGRKCQRKSLKSRDSRKEMAAFGAHFSQEIASNTLPFVRFTPK